jgi:hypothetical protein
LKLSLKPSSITSLSASDVKSIKKALTFARGCDEWNFLKFFFDLSNSGREVESKSRNMELGIRVSRRSRRRFTRHCRTRDPEARGKWFQHRNVMRVEWDTGSVEEWDLPLKRERQIATLIGQGKVITAQKVA